MIAIAETSDEVLAGPLLASTDAGVTIDVDGAPVFISEADLVRLDLAEAA